MSQTHSDNSGIKPLLIMQSQINGRFRYKSTKSIKVEILNLSGKVASKP